MIKFTPKKFISALELRGVKFTDFIDGKVKRSYFIPRYKQGTHKKSELGFDYKKGINQKSIENIKTRLLEMGIIEESEAPKVNSCFLNDNFDMLLPKDLL